MTQSKQCLECEKDFTYDSRRKNPIFCNLECYNRHKAHPKIGNLTSVCFICKQEFKTYNIRVKVCSTDCYSEYYHIKQKMKKIKTKSNRKSDFIKLAGGCCSTCGFNGGSRSLCFHHLDPKTKKFNLTTTNMNNYSYNTLVEEVKKCILLCHNCHNIEHEKIDSANRKSNDWEYKKYALVKSKIIKLKNSECLHCKLKLGENLSIATFHHRVKEDKSFDLSRYFLVRKKEQEILNELEKCDMLCFNCHMTVESEFDTPTDFLKTKYGDIQII